jgi:hypothetical protein
MIKAEVFTESAPGRYGLHLLFCQGPGNNNGYIFLYCNCHAIMGKHTFYKMGRLYPKKVEGKQIKQSRHLKAGNIFWSNIVAGYLHIMIEYGQASPRRIN